MSWQGHVCFVAAMHKFILLATETWNGACGCSEKKEKKASCW